MRSTRCGRSQNAAAFPGLYDEGGHLETSALALRTIFGLEHVEVQNNPHDGAAMLYPLDGTPAFAGRLYRQIVRPLDGTQVLAKYADGLAAATSCSLGAGRAIWLGSFISGHYHETYSEACRLALTRWMRAEGFVCLSKLSIQGTGNDSRLQCVVRLLQTDTQLALVAVNHTCSYLEDCAQFSPSCLQNAEAVTLSVPASDGAYILLDRCAEGE